MYDINELVALAKRENNYMRPYLYVNPIQGKHIPTDPEKMIGMCKKLAKKIEKEYKDEKIFIIGFSETATAIASCVAENLNRVIGFVTTTREKNNEADFLYFTESHSHATEQKLDVKGIEKYLSVIERIVFVEDEVTTGNTIVKLIEKIERKFPSLKVRYGIASVLNSMRDSRITELEHKRIHCVWIQKILFEYNVEMLSQYNNCKANHFMTNEKYNCAIPIQKFKPGKNFRSICEAKEYFEKLNNLCVSIAEGLCDGKRYEKMAVIGTEEAMYPAIKLALYLKEHSYCNYIRTHSTTRSPIMAFDIEGYPLYKRYQLKSVYDSNRITYIYNLEMYDKVIILTDSDLKSLDGIFSIINALQAEGCKDISVCQWEVE